ncbi:recombinase family protein [Clostridium sp.]|jgi:DNA invertase Pin-like site-specific DNA recombinase|uniref:recombinase family protein n=1 Tax=Clostridium sp. TaxID=1506 RepID=UPI003EF04344
MNIAYVKISTIKQNESRQLEVLKQYDIDKWFSEKVSSKYPNRPVLKTILELAKKDDTIYIHSLDKLASNTKNLLNIIMQLQAKGIQLVSSKENMDTSTATGKLMLTMIDAINTFERANMLERQRAGIAIAKENGVYKGRRAIRYPNDWFIIYSQYKTRALTGTKAMNLLGLKRNTFYKLLKKYEED